MKLRLLLLLSAAMVSMSFIKPEKLTCEYVEDPGALDITSPRLSWINTASTNGEAQTAYRIRVSSTKEGLRKPDMWDTGKVLSGDSFNVHYAGKAFRTAQDCWWQVCVWDSKGRRSGWSEPAHWRVGMLDGWQAEWIGYKAADAPLLRKSFNVEKKVVSAKAFVTGLGLYRFFVNGHRVGIDELTPNETNWEYIDDLSRTYIPVDRKGFRKFRVLYNGYDILPYLNKGENVIGAVLGYGFYHADVRWLKTDGTPKFIGEIVIRYEDGTEERICSDGSWMGHASPILVNDLFRGETYDARLEIADWCLPGTDLSGWGPVELREKPDGDLYGHYYVNDRIMETLAPKSIEKDRYGNYVVDFGDYISGWVRLRHLNGRKGDRIELKYLCEEKGNGPGVYILKGTGDEEYAPSFTWFAFDKVLVKGFPGELTADNLVAEAVYSDVENTGHFACSNELFNRINHIWWRSQTDNMHFGTASDCPHREKGPYTGDGEVACVTVMHNFDARAFYSKWIQDMSDCQNVETGLVPNGTPWHIGCGGGPGWGAAMNIIPWEFYKQYGDRDLLEKYYFEMTEQLRYMKSWITADGTMLQTAPSAEKPAEWMNLGDWLPPFELPDRELVHTYVMWQCADYTARAARALGRTEDAAAHQAFADATAAAFHKKFYNPATCSYGDYGANVFALVIGVPEGCRNAVIESLKADLARYDGHIFTGIIGTKLLFETLADIGLNELAFEALNKKDFPGFGWWLEQGAYTTWENWNGKDSRNHPMFGGGLTWFYRKLAGMSADENNPGYRHIIFKPMPCGDVTWAEYSNVTPYGKAGIRWDLEPAVENGASGAIKVAVTVPVGCTATLTMPDGKVFDGIGSGRHTFSGRL